MSNVATFAIHQKETQAPVMASLPAPLGYNTGMVEIPKVCVLIRPDRAERTQRVVSWLDEIPPEAYEYAMSNLEDLIWTTEYKISTGEEFPVALSGGEQTMQASEEILRRDWNRPEEDTAWGNKD